MNGNHDCSGDDVRARLIRAQQALCAVLKRVNESRLCRWALRKFNVALLEDASRDVQGAIEQVDVLTACVREVGRDSGLVRAKDGTFRRREG